MPRFGRAAGVVSVALLSLITSGLWASSARAAAPRSLVSRTPTCQPLLSATFLQPSYDVFGWTAARYDTELADMAAAGINTVILQWTVDMDGRHSYYPTASPTYPPAADLIGPLLAAADRHRAKVWLGLGNVSAWQAHAGDDVWLASQVTVDEHIADELTRVYPNRFAGWYISNEVDDTLLSSAATSRSIQRFLSTLTAYLHTHDGRRPVMSSPTYSGLHLSTAAFAAGVRTVMGSVDVLNVQDGGGTGYIAPSDITNWFRSLHDALAKTSVQLWQDADMYGSSGGPMAPLALQNDLRATCGLVAARSGFSFTSQMGPSDLGTSAFYDAYRTFRATVLGTG